MTLIRQRASLIMVIACAVAAATWGPEPALARMGLSIDASAMRFIYQKGVGGPGSIGRINIGVTASSSLTVQEIDLGANGEFNGGDDTVIDLAKITPASSESFDSIFQADVFYLGQANAYAIVGTYVVDDADTSFNPVVEGDFTSNQVGLTGNFMYFGGDLTNPDGVLRPGSPATDWTFTGDPLTTADTINGMFGGADGIDGTVTLPDREYSTLANLFEFQFVSNFPDLDAFFNSAIQTSTLADLKVTMVVPAPGAAMLGMIGLGLVSWVKRRFA